MNNINKGNIGFFILKTAVYILYVSCLCILLYCKNISNKKEGGKGYLRIEGVAQGTEYHITYENRHNRNYKYEIDSLLLAFNKSVSIYDSNSVITRINRNDTSVIIDDIFLDIFKRSQEIAESTNGMFDATVGPLVNAWGFGPNVSDTIHKANTDSLLQMVGYWKIKMKDGRIMKQHPGIKLDFNAIAQGYSVDLVVDFLEKKGLNNYLVEIGGEVFARGINDRGEVWRIGIDKPVDYSMVAGQEIQAIMCLSNQAMATSGNYRKFYVKNGVKYSHTIHPKTGYPVQHSLLSATIVAEDCMTADAMATACMVMGIEKGIEFINSQPDIEAYFIYSDEKNKYRVYYTTGVEKMLGD